ncbi:DUF3857 domain-containing protein [Pedobacter duraquae]|uniref:Transglutaminase-like putative cysteine protease n=1 Tax=Pedobacter duraquae TaxID=425511 RepID=A0A4R6IED2_9SPHI|nr:transglutaminase domain-containing protein [Pedobacter duraquae]TDO19987.1 transglutaminase-like putative cysteine protease [Pedobacter duraquae]
MIKSFQVTLLLIVCLAFCSSAQQAPTDKKFKFGSVDLSEFDTQVKGPDSAANAIKLFDIGSGSFDISPRTNGLTYTVTRHVRYKVVNKNAYSLADFEIQLYNSSSGGGAETLTGMRASTYNLVNGKIEVSKMAGDAKFTSRADKNHVIKKFTLPNVKEGSIIEYTYTTNSDFTFMLDDWYFQSAYPAKYAEFTFTVPEYYIYKLAKNGYLDINQTRPRDVKFVNSANATQTTYYLTDVPAIKQENFITTLDDYVSKLTFELTATNFPGSVYKDFSSTWPKLITELMDDETFGRFVKRNNFDKAFITSIVKDEKDSVAKMNLLFDYVKANIKWNEKNGYYGTQSSQKAVLEKKSGSTGDINLSLLGMLRAAGITCSPVLLSTRGNGFHPGYPMLSKFNSVVVQVTAGGRNFLLDATDEDNMPDMISRRNLNHEGLKINTEEKTAAWISLDNDIAGNNSVTYNLVLGEDKTFKGNIYLSAMNYDAIDRRALYKSTATEAEFLKNYKAKRPGLEISSYKIDNLKQSHETLFETMDVTIEDAVEDAGNLMYFTPLFFDRTKDNPFPLEERKFPVDFAHPFEENIRSVIEFPEKYTLDKLPKNEAFALPNKDGLFQVTYAVDGNKIAIKSRISIAKSVFSPEEYFLLKEFFKNIVRKQAEQIVFKKS